MKSKYTGSRLLDPFANFIGLPLDQTNYIVGQLAALAFAFVYRGSLNPKNTSPIVRHVISLIVGIGLGTFCFGSQIYHLLFQSSLCYVVLLLLPISISYMVVFAIAMGYLSIMHISNMYYDYGSYTLDITGPLMICTQKVIALAFSAYDGLNRMKEKLTEDQRTLAINKLPSFIEFFSYIFSFHGILLGPMCFYRDYALFVEGKQYHNNENNFDKSKEPSPNREVIKKLVIAFTCIAIAMSLATWYPKTLMVDPEFINNHGFVFRTSICILVVFLARSRYYFAWLLGEATNNAAGLGFNGYDEKNVVKWNLIENVNIFALETSTSFRNLINNWNIQTSLWLRRVCYDRLIGGKRKTYGTYLLSAIWHGFYPGYYFSFLGGAFTTIAARNMRKLIRPFVLNPSWLKTLYDIITWFCAQLALAYFIVPFTLLDWNRVIYFYTYNQYWWLHIVVGIMVALPYIWKPKHMQREKNKIKDNCH